MTQQSGWAEERMGGETSHCPSETCDARNPRRFLKKNMANVRPQCCLLHPLLYLFMDEEADELGDGLEHLGIEIGTTQSYGCYVRLSGELKSLGVGNSARRWFKL